MKLFLLVGMLLFNQQLNVPKEILLNDDGETIAVIDQSELFLPSPLGPFLNVSEYEQFLNQLDKQIHKEPHNATIDDYGNIQQEKPGYRLNRFSLSLMLYNSLNKSDSAIINVPKIPVYPQVDSELLSQIREKKIGQYVTYYNSYNQKRSYNIVLAAKAINNQVVFPGKTFSFNRVVGKRTAQKGYLLAPVIVKGEMSEGIGGGICQVSSTLFNAADNSGLRIVERFSHSKSVAYVPRGRDATVSWYGPDFRFTNKYNQPILIRAKTFHGTLVVTIYSSDIINFKPRKIPSASTKLPEEIKVTSEIESSN
ncbi:MAG TPA: VanW family protein [Pseudoneobacillus sp.]|nr:VanW family protein [Pseudoneobacillus sp.]